MTHESIPLPGAACQGTPQGQRGRMTGSGSADEGRWRRGDVVARPATRGRESGQGPHRGWGVGVTGAGRRARKKARESRTGRRVRVEAPGGQVMGRIWEGRSQAARSRSTSNHRFR